MGWPWHDESMDRTIDQPTMMHLLTHAQFLQHDTGSHPENANRLRSILAHPPFQQWASRCTMISGPWEPVPAEELKILHRRELIDLAERVSRQGGGRLDMDTVCSAASFDVARSAVACAREAVDRVMKASDRQALCLVRPPGHHATAMESMGFCIFNNIALAARYAQRQHGVERVLIVDFDVHHGNGTQDLFYDDPSVFFFSTHRFPFYPGTGRSEEKGTGAGLGYTLNVPLPFGITRHDFREAFAQGLARAAQAIKPQLVLISAGFDAHQADPVGSLSLEAEDFAVFTKQISDVAQTHAQGRIVSLLEGGYSLEWLPECVTAHLQALVESQPPQ